jgi:hypothetical protein
MLEASSSPPPSFFFLVHARENNNGFWDNGEKGGINQSNGEV